ncbi:MAG: molybdenum cofactor biosynthesis protein MoaE [Chloroflexi bacterium]|nr:molybdenum cofactor biosynthesis protein MoaE [Chloroflexota bacterium]
MRITVRLFALQRQQLGWRERSIDLPEMATIGTAWDHLVAGFPALAPAAGSIRFARNGVYADALDVLADGDELALIPPVAGGSGEAAVGHPGARRRIELWSEPFPDDLPHLIHRELATSRTGAVVTFLGQTRETPGTPAPGQDPPGVTPGGAVETLWYEAFEPMAISVLDVIADEIDARFGVDRIAILHRTGEVPVGEASVCIVAAAEHRGPAFDACRYAIEELKARAPIWKQERFADGEVWIGAPARPGPKEGPGSPGEQGTGKEAG